MNKVVLFTPNAKLSAQGNLAAFIKLARNRLTALGANLPFDANVWPLTMHIELKGRRAAIQAVFSDWDTAGVKNKWVPMPEPFLDFAKAYFRYKHSTHPTKAFAQRLAMLRALCKALSEHGTLDVTYVDDAVLNRAAQWLKSNFEEQGAYRAALQLEMLAKFLDDKGLVFVPLQWTQPLARPQSIDRVGKEFESSRAEKLPSPTALDALARIYLFADTPSTVVVSSSCALMICAPDRVNEVLSLRSACEHRDVGRDGKPIYGLRYWPSKDGDPQIKWILASMVTLCEEALGRIRRLTDEGRRIALWYEQNKTTLYLPTKLENLRNRRDLSMREVAEIVFIDTNSRCAGLQWCKRHKVPLTSKGKGCRTFANFADIQRVLLSMLPVGFPMLDADQDLKFSDALFVIPKNFLHPTRGTYRSVITKVSSDDINSRLGGRSETGIQSIFSQFDFTEEDGSLISITTHQFRHYLNTLAQMGGLSELDIAKWSGRKDLSQNRVYDHRSGRDLVEQMRDKIGDEGMVFGALATLPEAALVSRADFDKLNLESAHTTEYGYCIHNFVFTPCQLHLDCINCNELLCVKGDDVREANLRHLRAETQSLLLKAKAAAEDGEEGADRWYKHQLETLARVEELLALIDNPAVAPAAVIRLSRIRPASRFDVAHARRTEQVQGSTR